MMGRLASHAGVKTFALMLLLVLALAVYPQARASAEPGPSKTLQHIRERGEIAIGVKADMAPFGSLDETGQPVGFEIDIARKIADTLGVRLRLTVVTTENRFQRLEQGLVDLIVATVSDTEERRHLATAIEPNYYGGGVNVILRPEETARDWQDLRGRTVCALQGAYFNRTMSQRYLLNLMLYRSVRDAALAVQDRRCVGFLYTDLAINNYLHQPEWAGFRAPFNSALVIPWSINIGRREKGGEFDILVGDIVAAWHREGWLMQLERKWNITPSKFLQDGNATWSARTPSGEYVCRRTEQGAWPTECRNKAFITSADIGGVGGIGLWLKENAGLDLSFLYDPFDAERYARGLLYTTMLCFASIFVALVIAYFGAKWILARTPVLSAGLRFFSAFGQMTPPLLQMYLVAFGLGGWLSASHNIMLSPFLAAVLCLGFYHGGIMISALLESASVLRSRGENDRLTFKTLPEFLRLSSVGVSAALSNLAKATSIASAIAVPEILSASIAIFTDQGNPELMMTLLLVVFYFYSTLVMALISWTMGKLATRGAADANG